MDLENIEKLFVEKYRANKAKAATASKMAERVPKKRTHGGGSDKGAPKKGRSAKYCKWCKAANGPYIRSSPMSLTALEFSCFNLLGHVRDC